MGGVDTAHQKQASHRTVPDIEDDQHVNNVSYFLSNSKSGMSNNPASLNSSFRVENRRARPKIVQNVHMDQGNQFFSKQANILNTSHKRHRRGVSSPGTEFLFLNNNEKMMNQSAIHYTEHKTGTAANGTAPEIASQQQDRD